MLMRKANMIEQAIPISTENSGVSIIIRNLLIDNPID
jgi:hypothetical protein